MFCSKKNDLKGTFGKLPKDLRGTFGKLPPFVNNNLFEFANCGKIIQLWFSTFC